MTYVVAMCAIGQRGQLGLDGRLPWEGNREPEYVADVARFFDATRGHVLIAGPTTADSVPAWARVDRTIVTIRSSDDPAEVVDRFPEIGRESGRERVCQYVYISVDAVPL